MRKTEGWETRLFTLTSSAMAKPYEWGTNDCVTFAADCVEAMTGVDVIASERGTYKTELGAAKAIRKAGADNLGDLAAMRLREIPVPFATRGDIVLCNGPELGDFLAVCQGTSAVGPSTIGLQHVPMKQALRAFKVG